MYKFNCSTFEKQDGSTCEEVLESENQEDLINNSARHLIKPHNEVDTPELRERIEQHIEQ